MELDMTKGSTPKLIARFIIPLIIGNLFQQLYSMVDTIIVGQFLGVKALAAVGATGTISFLIIGFMQGMTSGFAVLTAQRFGAGDMEGLKKSVGNAAFLSVVITIIMTSVSLLAMNGLLHLMNTPDDIFQMSKDYIIVICAGMGFNILYNMLASLLRAVGNSKVPLYFLMIAAGLNIILDLTLIVVIPMGVAGAAWATVISQGISGVLCFIYITKKVPLLQIKKSHFKPDLYCCRNQIGIGLPMALQFSITAVGTMLVQSALNLLGTTAVASYTAALKIEQLVIQPFAAMGMTLATYCGQNRGTNDIERIKKGVRVANVMSGVYAVVIFGVVMLVLPFAIRLFVNDPTGEVLKNAGIYMKINGFFFIPLGMIFIFRNALQSCGFALIPMLGGVVELFARAGLAFVAAANKSFEGICTANACAWLTAGVFLAVAYPFYIRKLQNQSPGSGAQTEVPLLSKTEKSQDEPPA